MTEQTPTSYDFTGKTAETLWGDLWEAVGDSEYLYEALQSLAVRTGIIKECPRCEHTVENDQPVDPCECCEGWDD